MEAAMHEAKANRSKLVAQARADEEVILTRGKSCEPIGRMVAMKPAEQREITEQPIGLFAAEMATEFFEIEPMTEGELALREAPLVSTWTSNSPFRMTPNEAPIGYERFALDDERWQAIKSSSRICHKRPE